ncbi:Rhodanese-related sulfurtransferase [Thiohalospira halophila DSM 15071]|uniref:Rhodanese-related sulfurtransferase n=1 Tax=Thiohalospira halophila DSM 15071 TaxID=1123397 RepID=A0A1I1VIF5_9GAMM|nr:rhodanese-like domain-containing protein [Thiohalospira halophila]SFD82756.1 Rhodanese-related sulfurtransferase [Thiohalospira halophila DSM 15071]
MRQVEPAEFKAWLEAGEAPRILDVREPWEYEVAHLPNSTLIPLGELPSRAAEELDPAEPLVVLCHHGVRSLQAAYFLEHQGFADVINLTGGIDRWSQAVDPATPRY